MPYDLYRLLPLPTVDTEILERYHYPEYGLRDVMFATRVLGRKVDSDFIDYRTLLFSTEQDSTLSRDAFRTDSGDAGEFKLFLQLDGKGVLSAIHGMNQPMRIRITVDGEQSVTCTNNWNYSHLIWGGWIQGAVTASATGYFFYKGRETITDEYRQNFFKGGVHFESQLKIEYANLYSWSSRQTLSCDYLLGDET